MEFVYLTEEGLEKLKNSLHELKYKKRPETTQKVAAAREHGDLKENAEYHAAREELSFIETKIQQIQDRVAHARIIDETELSTDQVSILATVTIEDQKSKKQFSYTLVSDDEANFKEHKISISSPVGKGLLGKKVGEIAEIVVPAGVLHYKLLSISLDI